MTTDAPVLTRSEPVAVRARWRPAPGPAKLLRFAAIGGVSTLAYLALYILLAPVLPSQLANALALLVTAIANTAANRRFTFGVRGGAHAGTHHAAGVVMFAIGLACTSGALALLHLLTRPDRTVEVAALVGANLVVTLLRFVGLRWLFARDVAPLEQPEDPEDTR